MEQLIIKHNELLLRTAEDHMVLFNHQNNFISQQNHFINLLMVQNQSIMMPRPRAIANTPLSETNSLPVPPPTDTADVSSGGPAIVPPPSLLHTSVIPTGDFSNPMPVPQIQTQQEPLMSQNVMEEAGRDRERIDENLGGDENDHSSILLQDSRAVSVDSRAATPMTEGRQNHRAPPKTPYKTRGSRRRIFPSTSENVSRASDYPASIMRHDSGNSVYSMMSSISSITSQSVDPDKTCDKCRKTFHSARLLTLHKAKCAQTGRRMN